MWKSDDPYFCPGCDCFDRFGCDCFNPDLNLGRTCSPLVHAILADNAEQRFECVRLLLEATADPDYVNHTGWSALMHACDMQQDEDIFYFILDFYKVATLLTRLTQVLFNLQMELRLQITRR